MKLQWVVLLETQDEDVDGFKIDKQYVAQWVAAALGRTQRVDVTAYTPVGFAWDVSAWLMREFPDLYADQNDPYQQVLGAIWGLAATGEEKASRVE